MVLFIPGFMQRGDAWRPVAELLGERYPSTLLDHREHSLSGRLGEIAAAGEGAVLVGYSLGGRLALRAAIADPARYRGLITVGATAGLDDPAQRSARAEADERLAAWMEAAPIEDIVALWERQPLFADQAEALVERQRAGRLSHDPRELAMMLRTAGQGVLEPVWGELLTLELPLLAVAGRATRATAPPPGAWPSSPRAARRRSWPKPGTRRSSSSPPSWPRLVADFAEQRLAE